MCCEQDVSLRLLQPVSFNNVDFEIFVMLTTVSSLSYTNNSLLNKELNYHKPYSIFVENFRRQTWMMLQLLLNKLLNRFSVWKTRYKVRIIQFSLITKKSLFISDIFISWYANISEKSMPEFFLHTEVLTLRNLLWYIV